MANQISTWHPYCTGGWATSEEARQAAPRPLQDRMAVVHWPLDRQRLTTDRDPTDFRRELGVPRGKKVLLWLGRDHARKHPQRAFDCLAKLSEDWVLLYAAIPQTPAWQPRWHDQRMIDRGRALMTRGEPNRIGGLLACADVMVHTSDSDGGPRVVAEAWACGVPVVSTPVGIVRDTETQGLAKVIDSPDDGGAWAGAVEAAHHDKQQVARARRWVQEHCDPDRQVAALSEVFRRAAASPLPSDPRHKTRRDGWLSSRRRRARDRRSSHGVASPHR